MIAEICFTAGWLDKKRRELKGVDPGLLERALHAFALLGHLAESAALLTRLIAKEDANPSLTHWRTMPKLEELRSLEISGEWERHNRLKATNPEAFWYWYQASLI